MFGERDLYTVGGVVQAGGGVYLCRQADEDLMALCQRGEFAYILTARQTGKSSLMVRTAERLAADGTRVAIIDLTECGVLATPQEWYFGVVSMLAARLGLDVNLADWWQDQRQVSPGQRLFRFFTELVLPTLDQPIVIFVDEIDSTLSMDFTDDFFATIRYIYNARAQNPDLRRLSFVLIGVATPMDLISDIHRTPFNIGHAITLTDFTPEEARPLAAGLAPDSATRERLLGRVLAWSRGHPFLTQRLCAIVSQQNGAALRPGGIDDIVAQTFFGDSAEHDSNLQFVRDMLTHRARRPEKTLRLYRQILRDRRPVPDDPHSAVKTHLKLSGVVIADRGRLRVRNSIYASAFNQRWIKQHWPHNWWDLLPAQARTLLVLFALTFVALALVSFAALRSGQEAREAAAVAATGEAIALEAEARAQAEERRAAGLARLATLRLLIAQAQVSLTRSMPRLALLESIAALSLGEQLGLSSLPAAESVLRQALANLSGTSLLGHEDRIRAIAVSNDGGWLLTGGDDNDVRLWPLDRDAPDVKDTLLAGHTARVRDVAFTNDGRWAVSASEDGTVRLWDLHDEDPSAAPRTLQAHQGGTLTISTSQDGQWLATGGADGFVRLWDLRSEPMESPAVSLPGPGGWVWNVILSEDGRWLAAGTRTSTVRVWDLATEGDPFLAYDLSQLPGPVWQMAFSPDSRLLATGTATGEVHLFRPDLFHRTLNPRQVFVSEQAQNALAFSPDGRWLAAGGVGSVIRVWSLSVASPSEPLILEGHEGIVFHLAFHPDGVRLVSSSSDNTVRLWNLESPEPAETAQILRVHDSAVVTVALSPDGRWLTSGSWDGTAHAWDLEHSAFPTSMAPIAMRDHEAQIFEVTFSPDDAYVLASSITRQAYAWSLSSGQPSPALDLGLARAATPARDFGISLDAEDQGLIWDFRGEAPVLGPAENLPAALLMRATAISPDGRWLLATTEANRLVLLDLEAANPADSAIALAVLPARPIVSRFSAAGGRLLIILENKQGFLWQLDGQTTPEEPLVIDGHSGGWGGWFSPDGRYLATGGRDLTVRVWDLDAPDPRSSVVTLPAVGRVYHAAFAVDNRWLLVGLGDFRADLWEMSDLGSLSQPIVLGGHTGLVNVVALSPDGRWAATASVDRTIHLWDLFSRNPEPASVVLAGHRNMLTSVAFSHDSRWLVSGDRDGVVLVWPLERETLLDIACATAGRNFTAPERQQLLGSADIQFTPCPGLP